MSATVHDLISERAKRGRRPLDFDTDLEALAFIKAEVEQIRAETAGELLIPAEPLSLRLAQVSAVVSAIAVLYGHDERTTR